MNPFLKQLAQVVQCASQMLHLPRREQAKSEGPKICTGQIQEAIKEHNRACTQEQQRQSRKGKGQGQVLNTKGNQTLVKLIRRITVTGKNRKQNQHQTGLKIDYKIKQEILNKIKI